ncbi:hypothetical protein NESM_000258000 [Novymonas esmeraldas]|uniref:Uncharacterized protein n=1 Tax=Novymonas esmeraldas TaxID=1808958 RepID=A0AAW0FAT2_9TRYP
MEMKKSSEYKNVKQDFLCRACVALAEVFMEEVLPKTESRYRAYLDPTTGVLRSTSSALGHREREQLIVEVHEGIDELCKTLEGSIARQLKESLSQEADPYATQVQSPLVASKNLREGVAIACPMALEEMSDELASVAFQALLPGMKSSPSSESAAGAATGGESAAAPGYERPAVGRLCESVGVCSSYIHYHITSDAVVRQRAREGRAATPPTDGTGKAKERTTGGRAQRQPSQPAEDEEGTVLAALQQALRMETWRQLWRSMNSSDVLTVNFWTRELRAIVDPDVLFHLQGYAPHGAAYVLAVSALLLLAAVVSVWCCAGSSTRHGGLPTKKQQ